MLHKIVCSAIALALIAGTAGAVDWTSPENLATAALAANPTISRLELELQAARERVAPAAAQPNPMVMAGIQDKQVDLTDDEMMTMYMVGASQRFTRSSKRDARRTAAELEVTRLEHELTSVREEIARDVRFAWYELAAIDSQITAVEQVRELVDAITDAARVRYEIGTAVQAEVLRAQLTRSDLDHQLLTMQGRRSVIIARLLPLLGPDASQNVGRLALPRSTEQLEIDSPIVPADGHPAIAALRAEVERQEQTIRLARLAAKPDFSVEASYGYRRFERDMFSVVGSIELPFRRKQTIEPQIREAIALRDAARLRIDELRRSLTQDLAAAKAAHDAANEQLRFHESVLVPQARLAVESTLTSYQTGKSSFDSVLAAEATFLRLQIDYYEYLADHIRAITDFEALRRGARAGASGGAGVARTASSSTAASSPSNAMGGM